MEENNENGTVSGVELLGSLLSEAKKEEAGRMYRFEKDAHKRVLDSYYGKDLNILFVGQFNVGLLEVEKAILEFEQKDPDCRKKGIDIDSDTVGLTECQLNIAHVCAGRFLAKKWDKKEGKKDEPGNFSPDLLDEEGKEFVILPICPPCYQSICADIERENQAIRKQNEALKKQGKSLLEERPFPRSLSYASAEDAFDRRAYAIKMQTQGKQIVQERRQKRVNETESDTRRAVSRVAQNFKPNIARGVNRNNGQKWGHVRERRED